MEESGKDERERVQDIDDMIFSGDAPIPSER